MNIYIAGIKGMVGSAVNEQLSEYSKHLVIDDNGIDLRDQQGVSSFFRHNRIGAVVVAAARVGGIIANSKYPYDFIYDNLLIDQCVPVEWGKKVGFFGQFLYLPQAGASAA